MKNILLKKNAERKEEDAKHGDSEDERENRDFPPIVVQYCIYVAQHRPEYRRKENIEYADSQVDRYNELYFITWHHTSTTDAWLCCGMAIPHTQQYKVVPPSKFTW